MGEQRGDIKQMWLHRGDEEELWLDNNLWEGIISQRCIQEKPFEAGDKEGMAQLQFRPLMECVKPGNEQQSPPGLDHSGCFLCEKGGDLLWAEHVICHPYHFETDGNPDSGEAEWQNRSEESWRNHTASPPSAFTLLIQSIGKQVIPNTLLLCQDQAGKEEEGDEGCNSMLTIQREKPSTRSCDAKQHPDSQPGYRVRAVWRRWLSLWRKRIYTSKPVTNPSVKNCSESSKKPLADFWRFLSLRRLLLQSGSGHPHLVASDHLHMCQSAVESLQPCFMSSPLMLQNRCSLHDGEPVGLPHKDRIVERPLLETRLSPLELPSSGTNQRKRAPGSCNMLKTLHCCTVSDLGVYFGKESDSDLEELLVGDEVDGGDSD